jgi:hypothetical protein
MITETFFSSFKAKKNKAVFEKEKFEFIEFAITDLNILSDI